MAEEKTATVGVEPDMFIWDGKYGKLVSRGIKFVLPDQPEIPGIPPYIYLFYEPETDNCFKVVDVNGTQVNLPLDEDEKKILAEYCDRFAEENDYNVWPYDENRLYMHEMLKSQAVKDKLEYTLIGAPDHPASKFMPAEGDKPDRWEKIKAVIRTDGTLSLDPPALCQLCLLGYTEEEWEKMPHPKSVHERYDFKTDTWVDPRTLEDTKKSAFRSIQSDFDTLLWKEFVGGYTPQYQMDTWIWQVLEAKALLAGGPEKDALYLTTFLDQRTDKDKPSLLDLAKDVIKNHEAYLIASAKGNALLWSYKKRIEAATTNEECDKIQEEVNQRLMEHISSTNSEAKTRKARRR